MNEKVFYIRENKLNVSSWGDSSLPIVVLLHGFTGSAVTWHEVVGQLKSKFRIIAVDLTGHGKSAVLENPIAYSMAEQVADLEALFDALQLRKFTLLGYSMGGRIALAYTIKHPNRVSSLILESASPGLKTEIERRERQTADRKLAERILVDGVPLFVNFWESIPLFASQKKLSEAERHLIRLERLGQSATGLANSLIGIGTGSQPSYWEDLHLIRVSVLLITGEIDTKFVNIAREMEEYLPKVTHEIIKNAGHAIHVENPCLFATMVEKHLYKGN